MSNEAKSNERRFNERYAATSIKIEVRPLGVFSFMQKKHSAFAYDFSMGGISIVSQYKLKPEQKVLISLGCDSHRLQAIPMQVTYCIKKNDEYILAMSFNFSELPEAARNAAFSALKSIENELKQSATA